MKNFEGSGQPQPEEEKREKSESSEDAVRKQFENLAHEQERRLEDLLKERPELQEKIEAALEKVIDIQKYRGLLHFTHPGNVESILEHGLGGKEAFASFGESGQPYSKRKRFRRYSFSDDHSRVYMTLAGRDSSFQDWRLPWNGMNSTALLFDMEKIGESDMGPYYMVRFAGPGEGEKKDFFLNLCKKENIVVHRGGVFGDELDFRSEDKIPKFQDMLVLLNQACESGEHGPEILFSLSGEARNVLEKSTAGVVVSSQRKTRVVRGFSNNGIIEVEGLGGTYEGDAIFDPLQTARILANRLNRSLLKEDADVVPLYDNQGDVLWPKFISHTDILESGKKDSPGS